MRELHPNITAYLLQVRLFILDASGVILFISLLFRNDSDSVHSYDLSKSKEYKCTLIEAGETTFLRAPPLAGNTLNKQMIITINR